LVACDQGFAYFRLYHTDAAGHQLVGLAADIVHKIIVELIVCLLSHSIKTIIPLLLGGESPIPVVMFADQFDFKLSDESVKNNPRHRSERPSSEATGTILVVVHIQNTVAAYEASRLLRWIRRWAFMDAILFHSAVKQLGKQNGWDRSVVCRHLSLL
jgi:hypothetical protein